MVEMIWKEPPPAVSSKYAPVLGELKKNPGRWALVQEKATSSGAYQGWKKLGCETRVNRVNPGETPARYDVYARWPERKTFVERGTVREGMDSASLVKDRVVAPAGTEPKPPRPAGPMYKPEQRDARGIPSNGLSVESLRR